jgi:hypothetical protein
MEIMPSLLGASGLFLFGFTYLYVAMNNFFNLDGSGLGCSVCMWPSPLSVYAYFNFRETNGAGYVFGVLVDQLGLPVAPVLARA